MMKKTMILICLLVLSIGMRAADKQNVLVVLTKNGTKTFFVLKDKPDVIFEGTNLKIVSEKTTTLFPLADVLRFVYEKYDPTGINELTDEPANISYEDDVLVISQLKANASVGIYGLDGKLLRQLTAQYAGTYRLNLSSLPVGVYIVKADNITYKITKR